MQNVGFRGEKQIHLVAGKKSRITAPRLRRFNKAPKRGIRVLLQLKTDHSDRRNYIQQWISDHPGAKELDEGEQKMGSRSCFPRRFLAFLVHFPSVLSLATSVCCLYPSLTAALVLLDAPPQTFALILSIWRGIKVRRKWPNCKFRHADVQPPHILVSCTNKDAKLFRVWASASVMVLLNHSPRRFGSSANFAFFPKVA